MSNKAIVKRFKYSNGRKIIVCSSKNKEVSVFSSLHAPVGIGDDVYFGNISGSRLFLYEKDTKEKIIINPIFELLDEVRLGKIKYKIKIKEIFSAEEENNWKYLEEFHYKTNSGILSDGEDEQKKNLGGRKVVLLLKIKIGEIWIYVGYVEISMPLMMVGPRRDILNYEFDHISRDISWKTWNQHTIKKHLNLIARISRIVVHPNYRGIGLTKYLIISAIKYCKNKWNVSRRKPIFLDISAEMLNQIDFVSKHGFVFAGNTDGNLKRVAQDMRSMSKNRKITFGIMDLQKKYFNEIKRYSDNSGKTIETIIDRIDEISLQEDPSSNLTDNEWIVFRKILRFPRPYFILGLDDYSVQYLNNNKVIKKKFTKQKKYNVNLNIKNINVKANIKIKKTEHVNIIMDSFGLSGEMITQNLFSIDNLKFSSGNIILITGASGTGKSVLLDAISKNKQDNLEVVCKPEINYKIACMEEINDDSPIIDYFSNRYGLKNSFKILSSVGLADAISLIRPYWMLSKGQKYRCKLAALILKDAPIWIIDEFCSDLDQVTAQFVSANFKKTVIRYGAVAILAAANNSHFLNSLLPTQIINFYLGNEPKIITLSEYSDELYKIS